MVDKPRSLRSFYEFLESLDSHHGPSRLVIYRKDGARVVLEATVNERREVLIRLVRDDEEEAG